MTSIERLNPVILKSSYFDGYNFEQGYALQKRVVYDYEIEYYTKSKGGVVVDGKYIGFSAGDIGIRKPGQVVWGIMPYACYIVCLDLEGRVEKREGYALGTEGQKQEPSKNLLIQKLPEYMPAHKNAYTAELIKKIYQESLDQSELGRLAEKLNVLALLKGLVENTDTEIICPKGHQSIKKVINYIRENYTQSIEMSVLIEMSGFSKPYFYTLFQNYAGKTPNQFSINMRIEKAKHLLVISQSSISEISYQCGYEDGVYFSYIFKRYTGKTPSEFRNSSLS